VSFVNFVVIMFLPEHSICSLIEDVDKPGPLNLVDQAQIRKARGDDIRSGLFIG